MERPTGQIHGRPNSPCSRKSMGASTGVRYVGELRRAGLAWMTPVRRMRSTSLLGKSTLMPSLPVASGELQGFEVPGGWAMFSGDVLILGSEAAKTSAESY
eukprot:s746_g2.t1